MSSITLLRGARQLVTLAGSSTPRRGAAMNEIAVIPDGALLIVDGKISQVGPSRRVEHLALARQAEEIDATGHVVIPGFVDCYTRLLCGPLRWSAEPASSGVLETCRTVRSYSTQRLELEGRKRLRQFVRTGTTTLEASCGYGLDEATELKALRVLNTLDNRPLAVVPSYFGASHTAPEFQDSPEGYLQLIRNEILPLIAGRNLSRSLQVSSEFPADAVDAMVAEAVRNGFSVHVHTRSRVDFPGAATLRGLDRLTDIAEAARSKLLVLTPGINFRNGDSQYAPARQLIDAGAAVALASGFDNQSCPSSSIPIILSIACTQMGLTPAEALTAVTVNAAAALNISARAGSLEAGKQADLLILSCGDYRDIPICFGMNLISAVIRGGEQIYPMMEMT